MPELIAGLIDVFADAPLAGNPLAVVQDADALNDDQMRRIVGEFNQAETTFILQSTCADRKLRSFTASGAEVFGAGHNALGAWLWLLSVVISKRTVISDESNSDYTNRRP
jgi:PhzF family phenazine biosynthesis protein